jgi:hypothetical protein
MSADKKDSYIFFLGVEMLTIKDLLDGFVPGRDGSPRARQSTCSEAG